MLRHASRSVARVLPGSTVLVHALLLGGCGDDSRAEPDPAGASELSEKGDDGSQDQDILIPDQGPRSPILERPAACTELHHVADNECSWPSIDEVPEYARLKCLTFAEMNDECSPVRLRELGSYGAGGAGGSSPANDGLECPAYEDLMFGFSGQACGGTNYHPQCSVPVQAPAVANLGGDCCYTVVFATNAC